MRYSRPDHEVHKPKSKNKLPISEAFDISCQKKKNKRMMVIQRYQKSYVLNLEDTQNLVYKIWAYSVL